MAEDKSPFVMVLERMADNLVAMSSSVDRQAAAVTENTAVLRELKGWMPPIQKDLGDIKRYMDDEATSKAEIADQKTRENDLLAEQSEGRMKLIREWAEKIGSWFADNIVLKGAATIALSLLMIGVVSWLLAWLGVPVEEVLRLIPGVDTLLTDPPAAAPAALEAFDG